MMRKVLVAGATGYLGAFVAREFKDRGWFVRALVRSPDKADSLREIADEIVEGQVTRPETLDHVCDGMDVVFSSVGITRQKDGLTFRDVDYQGNANLLDAARRAGVQKFVYVSVFNGPSLRHLAIVDAHEAFVDELRASGIDHAILRPTGYFSDMGEFFEMAKKGRVYLIGRGDNRGNPIHGADLAFACVDAVDGAETEIDIGGPEVLTFHQIAELAFESLGTTPRISKIPVWVVKPLVALTKIVSRHQGELLAFFTTATTADGAAPCNGTHTLAEHFRELASATSPDSNARSTT
jgi:uncharacterized protein YbjT (DUF2867 family)